TDAHADADPDALGHVHGRVEQVHAAAVACVAEALQALLPLLGHLVIPGSFGGAQHALVAGTGAAVPGPAGHDPAPVERVEAVPGDRADGGLGGLVGGDRAHGAAGAHPQ